LDVAIKQIEKKKVEWVLMKMISLEKYQ